LSAVAKLINITINNIIAHNVIDSLNFCDKVSSIVICKE
jgi:hypothetical protein